MYNIENHVYGDGQAPPETDSYFGIDEYEEQEMIRKLKIHSSEITKQLVLTVIASYSRGK